MKYIKKPLNNSNTSFSTTAYIDPIKLKLNNNATDVELVKVNNQYAQWVETENKNVLFPPYIRDDLKCWLDANHNTRNGYDRQTKTWEDLSGNGNDFTLSGTFNADSDSVWWDDDTYNALGYEIHYFYPRWNNADMKIYRDNFDPFDMTKGWTLEFVFEAGAVENYLTLFRTVTDSAYREAWLDSSGQACIRVYNNTTVSASSAYTRNTMHTVSFRRNPATSATASASMDIAVDGKHIKSTSTAVTAVTVTKFFIFSRNANQYNFYGKVFGFRYYDRCLQRDEVAWNAMWDQVRYNKSNLNPLAATHMVDILNDGIAQTTLEANATLTRNASYGTWTKGRTTTSTGSTQGCIYAPVDVTNLRFINYLFDCTTDGGSDSYKIKGFCTQSAITNNIQSGTTFVDMGRATGRRWGIIDCSSMTGTYNVGMQTGTQLGTIIWIKGWPICGSNIDDDPNKPVIVETFGENMSFEWSNNNMTLTVHRAAGTGTQGVRLTANYSIKLTYTSYRESGWNSYSVSHGTSVNSSTNVDQGQFYTYTQTGSQQSASAYTTWVFNFTDMRDIYELTASGAPSSFNSGNGESSNLNSATWRTASTTVPAGKTTLTISTFSPAGIYGQSITQLLQNGTVIKNTGTRNDYGTVTSWAGDSISVAPGDTIMLRCRGAVDINRSTQTIVSASITFVYHE